MHERHLVEGAICKECRVGCVPTSSYCIFHKCKRQCPRRRHSTSEYCTAHKCSLCDAPSATDDNEPTFCTAHKCKVCDRQRTAPSEYCELHKCRKCSGEKALDSDFCPAHKCFMCSAPRSQPHQYCSFHASPDTESSTTPSHLVQSGSVSSLGGSDTTGSSFQHRPIRVGKYELGRMLGKGSFSEVRLAVETTDPENHVYAMKIVSYTLVRELGCDDLLGNEIALLRALDDKHIVKLHEVSRSTNHIHLVLQHLPGGELFDCISSKGGLSEAESRDYFQQLLSGVMYMHSKGVVHRDIKPENLLFDAHGVLKIVDLGFAVQQRIGERLCEALGTPEYQAPEMMQGRTYDGYAADVWSCGVVLYAMLQGRLPFESKEDGSVPNSADLHLPDAFSDGAKDLLLRMLQMEAKKRPTVAAVLSKGWASQGYAGTIHDPASQPLPQLQCVDLLDLPQVATTEETQLLQHLSRKARKDSPSWTLTGFLEEAAGFIGSFGTSQPAPPSRVVAHRQLVRPQNRWRRGR